MNRFFGMMPSSEIEKTEHFTEKDGSNVTIDAGPHGWTVTFCDNSTKYQDIDGTTEENFLRALATAEKSVGPLTKSNVYKIKLRKEG